jgi:iron complex outermembrane receptor protein
MAQIRPTYELDEVVVSDTRISNTNSGNKQVVLNDSVIKKSGIFLTSLLNFNSSIYFKENGLGMVSSPSFRGTNASHTAVVWNGININSQLTGQVDFNTINPLNYNSVTVRSGGGSVQFGSGAIGGTVHLNNDLHFKKHLEHQVLLGYGSFNTKSVNYLSSLAKGKWSANFGLNYIGSENDYLYLETDEKNANGEFEHVNLNFNAGYLLNDQQVLRLYHQSFIGDRNLSGTLVAPGRSRYTDNQYRTQLEWAQFGKVIDQKLKLAHLHEAYDYFENKDSDNASGGRLNTYLARYSLDYQVDSKMRLNSFIEYNHYDGKGSSFGNQQRNDFSVTALLNHDLTPRFGYALSLRQDFSSDYKAPIIFAATTHWKVGKYYTLQFNTSRNFRMPTFNDLYWQPGGNLDLKTERSYQVDMGHRFHWAENAIQLNGYYMETKDMIRWLPTNEGFWSPENVDQVQIYGLEMSLELKKKLAKKHELSLTANYGYTVSEDAKKNEQLIYVPKHRTNASMAYSFGSLSFFYQHLYNGPVAIIGGGLDGYQVANSGISYEINPTSKIRCQIGLTLNNLYNAYYQNVALRPMPNRNLRTQLVLNF